MNKAYLIGPLVGILVFGAFYWNFDKGYQKRQEQQRIQQIEQEKARILKQAEARKKAIEEAIAAQVKRAAERKAEQEKKDKEAAAFQALLDKRQETFDLVNRSLRPQLAGLKSDADDLKQQIKQLQVQDKQYVDEAAFLETYVKKAKDNVNVYTALLEKLAAAEKARAAAAAAAAKAKD